MNTSDNSVPERKYRNLTEYRFRHVDRRSPFYEEYATLEADEPYAVVVPEGWSVSENSTWKFYYPPTLDLPTQGWKIHISARPGDDEKALQRVPDLLFRLGVPFKHLLSKRSFMQLNMKYANRASSGKLITVYPQNDDQFSLLLDKLDKLTNDLEGPYILSDTQYKQSPVFFRYGGFYYRNFLNEDGSTVLAIQDPDGNLVEDIRSPTFVLPEFVSVPSSVAEQVHSRLHPDSTQLIEGLAPYTVQESLHFSNGGGVYVATNVIDGSKAVLKEARPHAGYTSENEDAIARLRHERDVLQTLQGIEAVPRYLGYKSMNGHEFLVESFLEGVSLQTWLASHYPFSLQEDLVREYSREALTLAQKIVDLVDEVHSRGYAIMDISVKNFIIDNSLNVAIIDFEGFREFDGSDSNVLGTPGFIPQVKCSNAERDLYGMVNVLLYMFWPSWTSAFSPKATRSAYRSIAEYFPTEIQSYLEGYLNKVPDRVMKSRFDFVPLDVDGKSSSDLVQDLVRGIHASRPKMRSESRRYPGDATQFLHGRTGMLDIETGAAGVMLMLHRAGSDVRSDMDWIRGRLLEPEPVGFHGLLRGTVGIASVFSQAGFYDEALKLLPEELPDFALADLSIRSGIAGTTLALCEITDATGDLRAGILLESAAEALERSIREVEEPISTGAETGNAVGLFDGWSGAAIACRELSIHYNNDPEWSKLMEICLRREVQNLTAGSNDNLYVNYSGVNFGYLSEGSAGIAFALAVCDPQRYSEELEKLRPGLVEYVALNGGLFRGLGGKIAALSALNNDGDAADISLMTRNVLEHFLFADTKAKQVVYALGDGGACLSADYASGAAGLIGLLLSLDAKTCKWFPVPLH